MSHIVSIHTEIRDPLAIRAACTRLHWPEPVHGEVRLYSSAATGWGVRLPEWRYPVVCDVSTGTLAYDNFEGRWGDLRHLNRFLQAYAVEKARLESQRRGHTCLEQVLEDGSIRLTIQIGGAA